MQIIASNLLQQRDAEPRRASNRSLDCYFQDRRIPSYIGQLHIRTPALWHQPIVCGRPPNKNEVALSGVVISLCYGHFSIWAQCPTLV